MVWCCCRALASAWGPFSRPVCSGSACFHRVCPGVPLAKAKLSMGARTHVRAAMWRAAEEAAEAAAQSYHAVASAVGAGGGAGGGGGGEPGRGAGGAGGGALGVAQHLETLAQKLIQGVAEACLRVRPRNPPLSILIAAAQPWQRLALCMGTLFLLLRAGSAQVAEVPKPRQAVHAGAEAAAPPPLTRAGAVFPGGRAGGRGRRARAPAQRRARPHPRAAAAAAAGRAGRARRRGAGRVGGRRWGGPECKGPGACARRVRAAGHDARVDADAGEGLWAHYLIS